MKYEKTTDKSFANGAKYQVIYNDASAAETVEYYLKNKAVGTWKRSGSMFLLHDLTDAFHVRLYFSEGLKSIREAQG